MLTHKIFNYVKNIIPKISETELIALRSGTVSLDGDLFNGKVDLDKLKKIKTSQKFPKKNLSELLDRHGDDIVYPNKNYPDIIETIAKNKFFSFIINEKYGGYNLTTNEMSNILTEITSVNPGLGVTIMVPNSLGPGELLENYGTPQQKEKYLPGLVDASYIPCFGLTGPNNGSDALGEIDTGVVMEKNGEKIIKININKRYITLAPIANLVGLAFDLHDPDGLLEKGQGKPGITLALLENNHAGLKQETYHNPSNSGFPNGTLKGSLEIKLNQVIGGEKQIGNGWKMLMECLAAGRGICLPATAQASSKTATYGVYHYAKHRKQFNIPLVNMEGVSNKLIEMFYHTWCIQSSISLTNNLLDSGEKPAVISAIMKQQTTDRGKIVLDHAMDIYAGSAICLGENNFLQKFYTSAPVGITVEGSNTLTRNLIIFGQGLNKSHPFIYPVYESCINNDIENFKKNFWNIARHSIKLYFSSLIPLSHDELDIQTKYFANLSNFVALLGGSLKKNQSISGDMADILSNLYLAYSVRWYHQQNPISEKLTNYCISRLLMENRITFNRVIDNYPNKLKYMLLPFKNTPNSLDYQDNRNIMEEISKNSKILDKIGENVWKETPFFNKIHQLENLDIDSLEYQNVYNQLVSVGEYPISKIDDSKE